MPDDKVDDFINRSAAGYRGAAKPDADRIWAAIEHDVADAIIPARRNRFVKRVWLFAGAAAAAALIIGVGLGRWSSNRAGTQAVATSRALTREDSLRIAAHRLASVFDHLGATEMFLTGVRADLTAGRTDADRTVRGRELLARTRLLLGAGQPQSQAVTRLLEDVELLLAEICALPDSGRAADAALIQETFRRNSILPRIRTTLPARAGL
jgi:hypothetical protein